MADARLCRVCTLLIWMFCGCVRATGYGDTSPGTRFGGRFMGRCDSDGMYYMDDSSYVMCSHSIAYIMPCAPGTQNSGRQLEMQAGDDTGFSAFCDVNLVDIGYAAFFSQQAAQNSGFGGGGGYGSAGSAGYGSSGRASYASSAGGYGGSRTARSGYGTSGGGAGGGGQSYGTSGGGGGQSYGTSGGGGGQSYGTKTPTPSNILITYRKQYGQTKRTAPAFAPARIQNPKTGYSQQQKNRMGYGATQSAATYGQILGFNGAAPKRNTYSVGSYNMTPRKTQTVYQG